MSTIIARHKECECFDRCMKSAKSEFIIVCGRRRIGKTFLVESYFENQFDFKYVGGHNLRRREQLANFSKALSKYSKSPRKEYTSWFEAFDALEEYLESISKEGKKTIFIDEMPWMDNQRSNFVKALENFWNGWANSQRNIVLIATGSATSWMVDKLLKNKGGLHNRVTQRLFLEPFTLKETKEYLMSRYTNWGHYEMLQCYMLTGGVPFYLEMVDPTESVTRNIDALCFHDGAPLKEEFDELYYAVFPQADAYIQVVKALGSHSEGLTRDEISKLTKTNGAFLTRIIKNLEKCNFIAKRAHYGNKKRGAIYRLIDFYTMFYFKFIEGNLDLDTKWWEHHLASSKIADWQGHTFEIICMEHHNQIKNALSIGGMATSVSTWRYYSDNKTHIPGSQIDMIIERADRMIHLCEMKFSQTKFNINADYERRLRERLELFNRITKNEKPVVHTFITTFGVGEGKHRSLVHSEVTMDDLFNT